LPELAVDEWRELGDARSAFVGVSCHQPGGPL
jgi:hypothetical protein